MVQKPYSIDFGSMHCWTIHRASINACSVTSGCILRNIGKCVGYNFVQLI